jgi:co-chaperonin GroES (HSP10)
MYCVLTTVAQTVEGIKVVDSQNNKGIEGLLVKVNDKITITNTDGLIEVDIEVGDSISLSHINYFLKTISVVENTSYISLKRKSEYLSLVNIYAKGSRIAYGNISLNAKAISANPSILGVPNLGRVFQTVAGVSNAQEMNSSIYIRGGNSDEVRTLLNGVPYTNFQHAFGLFSRVNGDYIAEAEVQKQGISPMYSNLGSGLVNLKSKTGSYTNIHGGLNLGTLSSSATLNGPIIKDRLSFYFDTHQAYTTFLNSIIESPFSFSDYFLNLSYKLNEYESLSFDYLGSSSYQDLTYLGLSNDVGESDWSSHLYTLHYNIETDKLSGHNAFSHSTTNVTQKIIDLGATQETSDMNIVSRWNYDISDSLKFAFGGEFQLMNNQKTAIDSHSFEGSNIKLFSIYSSLQKQFNSVLLDGGIRLDNSFGYKNPVSLHVSPRLLVAFKGRLLNYYTSYDRMVQFSRTLSQNVIDLPTDLRYLVSKEMPPLAANSLSVGVSQNRLPWLDLDVSAYFKLYKNAMDLVEGTGNTSSFYDINNFTTINSKVYGLDLSGLFKIGSLFSSNFSYTFTRSIRQSDEINRGLSYPAGFARPHILNSTLDYSSKNGKWRFTSLFTFQSGRFTTASILGRYPIISITSNRNSIQYPNYHRMDVSLTRYLRSKKRSRKSAFVLSIYNVYNNMNVFYVYWDGVERDYQALTAFPIFPSFQYSLKF